MASFDGSGPRFDQIFQRGKRGAELLHAPRFPHHPALPVALIGGQNPDAVDEDLSRSGLRRPHHSAVMFSAVPPGQNFFTRREHSDSGTSTRLPARNRCRPSQRIPALEVKPG